jgi:hypothetical protein
MFSQEIPLWSWQHVVGPLAKEHVSVADLSVAVDGYQDLITQALSRQVT